jgi:hypothetical protein
LNESSHCNLCHQNNQQNYNLGHCREKYGSFTPGQVERMVAEYSTFRDPNRNFNCGCSSCTSTTLQRSVLIPWIDPVNQVTCNDGMQVLMTKYGYSKYTACDYIGRNFWKECGKCHPSTCRYIPPPDVCAGVIVKNHCACVGGRPRQKCVRRRVQRSCNFGSQAPLQAYVDNVWQASVRICRKRLRNNVR